jgi:FAD:protein FMN transferase
MSPAQGAITESAGLPGPEVRIATRDPGQRRAERVMGTVISLFAPGGGADSAAADRCFAWLHEVDRRFSPFRSDSEVSQLMRTANAGTPPGGGRPPGEGPGSATPDEAEAPLGILTEAGDLSPELAEVLELCEIVETLSDGAFDIRRHRADGAPDPTGVVKGWAVDRAGDILADAGLAHFCIGAGGDVLARGGRSPGEPWRIGVAHPSEHAAVSLTLEADDLAVATSGSTERGHHIVDARTGQVPRELLTLSVAGPSLARADAYATAAFAMGTAGLRWCEALPGYAACGTTPDGRLLVSRGLQRYLRDR